MAKKELKRHGKRINVMAHSAAVMVSDDDLERFLKKPDCYRRGRSQPSHEILADAKSRLRGAEVVRVCSFCPKHNF